MSCKYFYSIAAKLKRYIYVLYDIKLVCSNMTMFASNFSIHNSPTTTALNTTFYGQLLVFAISE